MLPELSQRNLAIGVVVLLSLHLAITVPLALTLNVWTDEASTLYATQNGFWVAFQTAAAEQKQAPLYFWVMSLWRMADGSLFFARLFSTLCSLGAIVVFYRLTKRFFSPFPTLLATAFIALHPFLIWASVEVRVYSLVVLLSVVLIRLFFDAFFTEDPPLSRKSWWFLVFAVISLYTNYYLGFLIAGLFFALIATRRWRAAIRYACLMIIAGAAFLPLILTAATELQSRSAGSIQEHSLIDGVKIVWNHVLTFLLPTEIFPPEQQSAASMARAWIVRLGLVAIGVLAIWKRKEISSPTVAFAVVAGTIGFCMIVAGFLVGPSLIVIRHSAMLYVTVVLAFALLVRDVSVGSSRQVKKIVVAGIVPLVAASLTYGIIHIYPENAKRGDWAKVANFIQQNESSGQPILVFPTFDALSPRYHYKGINQILPDEKFFDFIPGASVRSPENLRSEIEFAISELPADSDKIWLAVGSLCTGHDDCSQLQNYIDANYTKEIEKDFYLEKLYLLKKKPQ